MSSEKPPLRSTIKIRVGEGQYVYRHVAWGAHAARARQRAALAHELAHKQLAINFVEEPEVAVPTTSARSQLRAAVATTTIEDVARASTILDVVGDLLPSGIANQEIGDALDRIEALCAAGMPRWRIHLVVGSQILWAFVNTIRFVVRALAGKAKRQGAE